MVDREEILKQAKKIMDSFHSALSSVEKEVEESRVERDECEREEQEPRNSDSKFREIMFKNAPETDEDCIKAERGKWV